VGCGLLVGVSKGRAVAVKGDPASPVNRGLACVKGYHSVMALYGRDRLTRAMVRKDGKLVPVPMKEALDLVASKMAETIKAHGKDSVALYGSGQWTIPDGYVASKLMKGAIGTNNLEANARLCMSSAVTGFMTSFGLDEPMGCYDDIDHADVFVLWGNNMAEMHPVLFSRLLERRLKNPEVKIIDLATRWTRTSMAADRSILFKPQTDLAIANAICHEIIRTDAVHEVFVRDTSRSTRARPISATGSRTGSPSRTSRRRSTSRAIASCSPTTRWRRWRRSPGCPRGSCATWPRSTPTPRRR
jgi:nitrate reductase NapA